MVTLYIGEAEVDAYTADLVERLYALQTARPTVWLPVGPSGRNLAKRILQKYPALLVDTVVVPAHFNRTSGGVVSIDAAPDDLRGKDVLVIDSAVHSGNTMLGVVEEACSRGAASVFSYTLVLKRTSVLVPTLWGVMIDDHDRAYFMLDSIPNNRLKAKAGVTHLRQLVESDIDVLPPVISENAAMNRITWADRWFDIRCGERERSTYLLYSGGVLVGYVTCVINGSRDALTIDEVAVDKNHEGKGFGGVLMRFVETMARHVGASEINLWGVDKRVPLYEHEGYQIDPGVTGLTLEGSKYIYMRKQIVHHVSPLRL